MNNADTLQNITRMQSQMKKLDELYANTLNEIKRLEGILASYEVHAYFSKQEIEHQTQLKLSSEGKIKDLTALKYSIFNEQLELGRVIMCELHAINY